MRYIELFEAPVIPNNFPWHLPIEARDEILSWPVSIKSPHSHSYYNTNEGEISWDEKPTGSLRLSDHWNFYSKGTIHCPTNQNIPKNCWALGKWDGNEYQILKTYYRTKLQDVSDAEARKLSPSTQRQRLKIKGVS